MKQLSSLLLSLVLLSIGLPSISCTTILVGAKASQDGSTIIARNDDNQPLLAQHYVIHPERKYELGQMFKSNANAFSYPMPSHALKYTGMPSYGTDDKSHEEAGMNSLNVAVSATETIYNSEKPLNIDPYVLKTGINEDSIASILLPRIHSAKEGVTLLGEIVEKVGAAEGFGVAISDTHDVWYIETASGHQWIAMRLPPDAVFVSANQGRIQKVNLNDAKNFLASPGLIKFAISHKLYNPKKEPFDFRQAFMKITPEDKTYNYPRLATLFKLYSPSTSFDLKKGEFPSTFKPEHPLSVLDVMNGLQNYYQNTEHDPYLHQNPSEPWRPISVFRAVNSHVIALHANRPSQVAGVEYVAMGMSNLSLYVPFLMGLDQSPNVYRLGTFTSDNQSVFWAYRNLQTLAMTNFPLYGGWVHQSFSKMQKNLIAEVNHTIVSYQKDKQYSLITESAQNATDQSLALVHELTYRIFTRMAANINQTYQFEGA